MNEVLTGVKSGRMHVIDLLKFFAAVLITNSHMIALYPEKYNFLASGGAIGDSLFFFCSGFLLIRGRQLDFMNWYKRRINRIFPTIFAVALIGIAFFGKNPAFIDVILKGGGWFVQAIFVFYALFWPIKRYCFNRLWLIYILLTVVILLWFFFFWDKSVSVFSSETYLRWPFCFMMMLVGASVSNQEASKEDKQEGNVWIWVAGMVLLLLLFNGYQFMGKRLPLLKEFQIVLFPIDMALVYCIYKVFSSPSILKIYLNKHVYWIVYAISACCLEVYLTGFLLFEIGQGLIDYFPLNILLTFVIVFFVAYLTKVFSNFLGQTFKTEKYDWKGMVRL